MKQAFSLLMESDLALARLAVSVGSLMWAAILLFGGNQFDRPAYAHMADLAPQNVWGSAFGLCGVLQFVRVVSGVSINVGGLYSKLVAGLIAWLWCFVTAAILLAESPPHGLLAGTAALAALSGLVFIRVLTKHV